MAESQQKKWCDAPPCGHCREQQMRVTIEGGRGEKNSAKQIVKERRERRVRLLHTVQHARQNTTSLYTNASTSE